MNVGFVHPSYPSAEGEGAIHSASTIVAELAARGHDVTVYPWERPPEGTDLALDCTVRPLDTSGYPYHSALQLDAALRERTGELADHDVVHSYVMHTIPALARVDTATVVTLNAYGAVCPKNDLRYMDREPCTSNGLAKCTACSLATSGGHDADGPLYRSASRLGYLKLVRECGAAADRIDGYHALSPHLAETYADFGFPRERLAVVPNILDDRFDLAHTSEFEPPYDLLYVGSLAEHKGVDRLLPLLARLNRGEDGPFRLTAVGDGGRRTDLERKAEASGLGSQVAFTGWVDNAELPAIFAAHDAFVYPGQWDEPFGRVFLEALGTGTPVVASDVGSVASIVGPGGVTTDGSAEALADAILALVATDRLADLSAAARDTVDRYRAETVVPQFVDLYERARQRS